MTPNNVTNSQPLLLQDVLKKLLASGMTAEEILAKLQ